MISPADGERYDQMARELAEARAENIRLQAIVTRLPKTADGVPVVPGSSFVWRISDEAIEQSCNWSGWAVLFIRDSDDDGYWPGVDPSKTYSTREAAEAARAEVVE